MNNSLDGVRVLELARYQAGPRAGMMMSDLGAEVIKIERIGGEDTRNNSPILRGQSVYFSVYNRGKKSICLDMRTDRGKEVFTELVRNVDIVLENFRPGTMKAMGFDYPALKIIKNDIILVSVSGFGQYGPYSDRIAFDTLGQALSGLMTLTGQPVGKPIGTAFSLVDRTTSLHATIGTLAALRHRDRTGEGQMIDCCLMDSALTMVEIPMSYYLGSGEEGGEPGRPPYPAKDGSVMISAPGRAMRNRLLEIATGKSENHDTGEDRELIEAWTARHTMDEIVEIMIKAGIPAAPVRNIPQVVEDPHVWEREMLVKMDDPVCGEIHLPGVAIKMSATPGRVGPVPTAGQHTDEVLSGLLGYDEALLDDLRQAKAIA
ncbi:MAG: CaiB/BaiF CoA transferase family protein [Rhodospirillales bacterium]